MLFNVFLLTLVASVFAATFKIRDLVVTRGLQAANFEDRLAIVVGDAVQDDLDQTRYPVIFWMGLDQPVGPFSVRKTIKPQNLVAFQTYWAQIPSAKFDSSDLVQVSRLNAYGHLIFGLGPVQTLLDKGMTECLTRLVGGAVCLDAGFSGMVYVAELRRSYTPTLEHAWSYVGRFLA